MAKPDPVAVVGAGPVGLCLALALAQQDIAVTVIESMTDDGKQGEAEGNRKAKSKRGGGGEPTLF